MAGAAVVGEPHARGDVALAHEGALGVDTSGTLGAVVQTHFTLVNIWRRGREGVF